MSAFSQRWTRQPQGIARLRSDIWTPEYFWAQNNGPATSGRRIITRTGTPGTIAPSAGGIGIGHNGTSQYENYAVALSAGYPFIQGGFFQVTETATGVQTAVGYGGATLTNGLYGGVGQYTSTSVSGWGRHTLSGADAAINGPTAVVGQCYAAVHISRSATNHVLYVNGVRYAGSTDAGVTGDSIANFVIGASNRNTTPIFYGKQNVMLGFVHQGYDPGDDWMRNFSLNPWSLFAPQPRSFYLQAQSGGTSYTLAADAASFTLSGQDAGLTATRTIAGDAGSFALAGQDAGLYVGRKITGDAGAFAFTGQDADLVYTQPGVYTLAADAGAFALDGQDAALIYGGNTPFAGGGGGGGGRPGYRPRFQIIYPNVNRGKTIDKKIGEWIEAIVAGEPVAEEPAEVAQVRKVVKPYVREDTIDLAAMQRDAKQVRALLKAYEAEAKRMADEEDDELMMMVL